MDYRTMKLKYVEVEHNRMSCEQMIGGPLPGSSGRESCAGALLIRVQSRVFRDADHRKDLLEMRLETEGLNGLAALVGRDHHLNNKGDPTGVEVVDTREVEKDAFGALRNSLIG